ncbi:MAG: hypothetical protein DWQ01_11030 [Planctomycetota bacterium]|nr:MAG: hypothetical protein DWQ01_11030 [Planctomycetota bacterium]
MNLMLISAFISLLILSPLSPQIGGAFEETSKHLSPIRIGDPNQSGDFNGDGTCDILMGNGSFVTTGYGIAHSFILDSKPRHLRAPSANYKFTRYFAIDNIVIFPNAT